MLFFFFYAPATTEIYTLSLHDALPIFQDRGVARDQRAGRHAGGDGEGEVERAEDAEDAPRPQHRRALLAGEDRKSTRLNSSHGYISYAVFCLKKKKKQPRVSSSRTAAM